jgi:hypothetical protein
MEALADVGAGRDAADSRDGDGERGDLLGDGDLGDLLEIDVVKVAAFGLTGAVEAPAFGMVREGARLAKGTLGEGRSVFSFDDIGVLSKI